ncbi:hypothetical protein C8R47DRAFT_740605 [Mycena vitilis]|nr:hypothetical protein C8R47DRAFT_1078714 [Mycena vitilis]KAJ6472151.1 hypothetical protein C8R47DRAFT_740605 [Mycena vitilis]
MARTKKMVLKKVANRGPAANASEQDSAESETGSESAGAPVTEGRVLRSRAKGVEAPPSGREKEDTSSLIPPVAISPDGDETTVPFQPPMFGSKRRRAPLDSPRVPLKRTRKMRAQKPSATDDEDDEEEETPSHPTSPSRSQSPTKAEKEKEQVVEKDKGKGKGKKRGGDEDEGEGESPKKRKKSTSALDAGPAFRLEKAPSKSAKASSSKKS